MDKKELLDLIAHDPDVRAALKAATGPDKAMADRAAEAITSRIARAIPNRHRPPC